jgi:uncharacterized protein (DUF488 family)
VSEPRPELFTIGHSNHPAELFLDLLRHHEIAALADVRSRPYSRFVPHFSKERLRRLLHGEGISYLWLGAELGGRPAHGAAPSAAPDYASRIAEPGFETGIERLLAAAREQRIAMVCRERDPLDCHRLHLICRYVKPRVAGIYHILSGGAVEPQTTTERRLLERSRSSLLPLFEHDDRLERAYDAWWQKTR